MTSIVGGKLCRVAFMKTNNYCTNLLNANSINFICPKRAYSSSKRQDDSELSIISDSKKFLLSEFPEYFNKGKYTGRMSFADFVERAMEKMDDMGQNKNLEVYKEVLRTFPEEKYWPRGMFDLIGLFNPVEQNAALRLLLKLEKNRVRPDKELEYLIVRRFSKHSIVWQKVCRMNYWMAKLSFIDQNKLPEKLPKQTHELAKLGMIRMMKPIDFRSEVTVTNTANFHDAQDKTWIVSCQSPIQQSVIEQLDEKTIVRVESGGLTYVGDDSISYYVLKADVNEYKNDTQRPALSSVTFDANKLKFSFFGKPISEKLYELNHIHHTKNYQILAIGMTGTSSNDSLVSWIKHLQISNPKLNKLSILYNVENFDLSIDMQGKPSNILGESAPTTVERLIEETKFKY